MTAQLKLNKNNINFIDKSEIHTFKIDVTNQFIFAGALITNAVDADVDDGDALFDHVGRDEARNAGGDNEDVGALHKHIELRSRGIAVADGGRTVTWAPTRRS